MADSWADVVEKRTAMGSGGVRMPMFVFSNGANFFQEVCECVFLVFGLTRLRAAHGSTSHVHTRGPTSLLTGTLPLLAPNVSDNAEVLSLPSFTVQEAFGFHGSSFPNVMKRGVYTRKDLYANAAFTGGTRCVAPAICHG